MDTCCMLLLLILHLQTFGEFLEPIAHIHFNVEGTIEFTAMMFVPGMAPFEQQNWAAKSKSIKLYVRRVFISDEFDDDLMPRWVCAVSCMLRPGGQAGCRLDACSTAPVSVLACRFCCRCAPAIFARCADLFGQPLKRLRLHANTYTLRSLNNVCADTAVCYAGCAAVQVPELREGYC